MAWFGKLFAKDGKRNLMEALLAHFLLAGAAILMLGALHPLTGLVLTDPWHIKVVHAVDFYGMLGFLVAFIIRGLEDIVRR